MARMRGLLGIGAAALLACEPATQPAPGPDFLISDDGGVTAIANGGGHYDIDALGIVVQFSMSTVQHEDGRASGRFHHSLVFDGQLVEFHGAVTCLAHDPVEGRAWIGGIVTENNSEHPAFQGEIHQPGKDLWFRVVDYGDGQAGTLDRTTFVGFEGAAGIDTSAEYCLARIWPDGDARTWPVIEGDITVRP